jgi:multidrug efflux pump
METGIFNEQKVFKAYMRLSIPLVCSMVVTLIYNLADTFFVAQTNDTNIVAGVSLGVPVFTTFMALGNIFGQGGSSLLSRLLGEQKQAEAGKVSAFCFYAAIFSGVIIGGLMLLFQNPLLSVMGANQETFPHASQYFFYLALGAPAVILSFIHSNLLRAEGMSKESMAGTILGAVVNIILDPVFISVLQMGATGAAIATVIGYICSDVFFAVIVVRKSKTLTIHPKDMKMPGKYLGQVFGIGIPAAIVNLAQSVSVVVMNQCLLTFGNDKIAAMGIVQKVSMIALLLLTGFAFGGQPLFGYYYGAKDKKRFSQLFRLCLVFITGLSLALSLLLIFLAPVFMRIFMNQESIIADGSLMLRWQVISMVFVGFVLLMTIIFQSTGKVVGSFVLSISRQGVIFLLVLAAAYALAGYQGIIVSQAIADVITAAIAAVLFRCQVYQEMG